MKQLVFFVLFVVALHSSSYKHINSQVCKQCHPLIYEEYSISMHAQSSVYKDIVHKAAWEKYPDKANYSCGKCHTPSDVDTLQSKSPKKTRIATEEPISCVYCHSIKEIDDENNILSGKYKEFYTAEKGKKGVANFGEERSFFGLFTKPKNSPFHKINYTNDNYYNGNVCMGCHSDTQNSHGIEVLMLDAAIEKNDKYTCIKCHMSKTKGSKTTIYNTRFHASHKFAGAYNLQEELGKYIDIAVQKKKSGFNIEIHNQANHALFGGMFRQGILKVTIERERRQIDLEPFVFERVLGKNAKATLPWEANEVLKDTLVYAKRRIFFDTNLKKGDRIHIVLGIVALSKNSARLLDLVEEKKLQKMRVLKHLIVDIKE